MKKITTLMLMTAIILTLVGCQSKPEEKMVVANKTSVENEEDAFDVAIIADSDSTTQDGMPITLSSQLTGESDKDLQYRWIIENSHEYEEFVGFIVPENGPQKKVINSGEPVELG